MTVLKVNPRPFEKTFSSLFDDIFQNFPASYLKNDWNAGVPHSNVPVNIKEDEHGYHVDVVAPGMDKSDFKINIEKNLLTISGEKKTETRDENERQVKREFSLQTFSRSFTLDDSIESAKIEAKYEQGVLKLFLPKKEEVKLVPKEITIQ